MVHDQNDKRVVISADAPSLASSVARRFVDKLVHRTHEGKIVHVALTGGTIGTEVLRLAGKSKRLGDVTWPLVHFWWGDERFVPSGDDQRNEAGARTAFLSHVDIPAENIHQMAPSDRGLSLDDAAAAYAAELSQFSETTASGVVHAWPSFDICFLGVGPDGHIASLFPDRAEIQVTDRAVVAVRNSPKPPPERVSLTRPVINSSKRVWMVISGSDKAAALGLALAGASYASVPAAGAKGRKRTVLFVDQDAAAQVPPELIDREY